VQLQQTRGKKGGAGVGYHTAGYARLFVRFIVALLEGGERSWSWGNPRKESRAKSWMPLIKCIELAARHSAENGALTSFLACKTFSEIVEQTWSNSGVSYATDKDINTFHRLEQCDKILCRKFAIVFI